MNFYQFNNNESKYKLKYMSQNYFQNSYIPLSLCIKIVFTTISHSVYEEKTNHKSWVRFLMGTQGAISSGVNLASGMTSP